MSDEIKIQVDVEKVMSNFSKSLDIRPLNNPGKGLFFNQQFENSLSRCRVNQLNDYTEFIIKYLKMGEKGEGPLATDYLPKLFKDKGLTSAGSQLLPKEWFDTEKSNLYDLACMQVLADLTMARVYLIVAKSEKNNTKVENIQGNIDRLTRLWDNLHPTNTTVESDAPMLER